jgi:glutamate racemase
LVLPHLRARFSVPFVGTVPAIKPACAQSVTKRVTVLGTEATSAGIHRALIRDFANGADVALVGSARLAAFAEAELHGAPVADQLIAEEVTPCFVDGGGRRTRLCSPARIIRCCSTVWRGSPHGRSPSSIPRRQSPGE